MEWTAIDFSRGVVSIYEWDLAERQRAQAVAEEVERLSNLPSGQRPPYTELARLAEGARLGPPLWLQIVGFQPWTDRGVHPEERRAGLDRLLMVVRTLFEGEWAANSTFKNQNSKCEPESDGLGLSAESRFSGPGLMDSGGAEEAGGASRLFLAGRDAGAPTDNGGASRIFLSRQDAGGPAMGALDNSGALPLIPGDGTACRLGLLPEGEKARDPLVEICFYLGIARSRLSALCLERTGASILEFLDGVRVRHFRARLKAVLNSEVAAWEKYQEYCEASEIVDDWRVHALQFLKWIRVTGRGVPRQRLAWELGMSGKARLSKAVFRQSGVTLEELEVVLALEVLKRASCEEVEPRTMENSFLSEIFNAPGAEKSEEDEPVEKREVLEELDEEGGAEPDGATGEVA